MQIKKVILVIKTHFDIGFTKLSREILEDYAGEMLTAWSKPARRRATWAAGLRLDDAGMAARKCAARGRRARRVLDA